MTAIQADVVLVGGGIMSATLGMLLQRLDPSLHILMLEQLPEVARVFMYLPLEHAEDPAMQQRSVAAFEALLQSATDAELRDYLAATLDYAHRHQVVIERFCRFPHRNSILGRASTAQEAEYLAQPGSGF